MANQIERDVYVLQERVRNPIEYVRLTNALPIVFNFRDYDIPASATADIFVMLPDGTGTETAGTISENTVTVDVQKTMFSVLGWAVMQVKISSGEDDLVTFKQPVYVKENITEGDYPPSQNTGGFFDEAQEVLDDVKEASELASQAAESAQTAVKNANQAVSDAQTAVSNANQAVSNAQEAADAANEAAQGIDTKVQQAVDSAVTPEALQPAVNNYFDSNPVLVDCTPTVEGTTLVFPDGISPTPGANIEQDVANLKQFAGQFDGKTLYTE